MEGFFFEAVSVKEHTPPPWPVRGPQKLVSIPRRAALWKIVGNDLVLVDLVDVVVHCFGGPAQALFRNVFYCAWRNILLGGGGGVLLSQILRCLRILRTTVGSSAKEMMLIVERHLGQTNGDAG